MILQFRQNLQGPNSTLPTGGNGRVQTTQPPSNPGVPQHQFHAHRERGQAGASNQHLAALGNLFGQSELKLGSRGPEVRRLQEKLNKESGGRLEVDGIFGPKTAQALERSKHKRSASAAEGPGPNRPGSGKLAKNAQGRVNPNELRAYLEQRIAGSGLNGFKPQDGDQYGVDGSAKSWANFMTKLVGKESDFNSNDVSEPHAFRGGSRGLFQLSMDDSKNYGLNGGRSFTSEQLADPKVNADAAVTIMERLVKKSGSIRLGAGKYWGPIQRGWHG